MVGYPAIVQLTTDFSETPGYRNGQKGTIYRAGVALEAEVFVPDGDETGKKMARDCLANKIASQMGEVADPGSPFLP